MLARLVPLFVVIFVSFFCYSSMLTMFVPMLQDSSSPLFNAGLSAGARNVLAGVFLALYPLGQFFGSPVIGAISDRVGRKRVLIVSLLVSFVSVGMISVSIFYQSVFLLGVFCFVAGLGESNMTIALSSIAGMTTLEERGKYFGYAWVMCSLGYIVGSIYGGLASVIGYTATFAIEAAVFWATILLTWFLFQEPTNTSALEQPKKSLRQEAMTFFEIFKPSPLRAIYLSNFLFYIAFFGVLRVELIYMQDCIKLTPGKIAYFYSYASVVAMIGNFIVAPRLSRILSLKSVLLLSVSASALSAVIFVILEGETWLYLTTALIGLSVPIVLSSSCAYLSSKTSAEKQGVVMGNNQSLQVISEAISAAAGGAIFAYSSRTPFLMFAGIGLLGILITEVVKNKADESIGEMI